MCERKTRPNWNDWRGGVDGGHLTDDSIHSNGMWPSYRWVDSFPLLIKVNLRRRYTIVNGGETRSPLHPTHILIQYQRTYRIIYNIVLYTWGHTLTRLHPQIYTDYYFRNIFQIQNRLDKLIKYIIYDDRMI